MGSFFDSSEAKCVAGLGLTALGIGIGIPVAAEACTEVVEQAVEELSTQAENSRNYFEENICRADSSARSYAELLFGPVFPITTLTVPMTEVICEGPHRLLDLEPDPNQIIEAAFPFAGPLGWLAYGAYEAVQSQVSTQEALLSLTSGLVSGLATMGAAKLLSRIGANRLAEQATDYLQEIPKIHFKQFKRMGHPLPQELLQQFQKEIK